MKNLFLAFVFIFIGSIGFANESSIISLDDDKKIDFDISYTNNLVFFAPDSELITSLKYQLYQLCIAYEEFSYENETGGAGLSVTFYFIGNSVNDEHCELMKEAAKEQLSNSY